MGKYLPNWKPLPHPLNNIILELVWNNQGHDSWSVQHLGDIEDWIKSNSLPRWQHEIIMGVTYGLWISKNTILSILRHMDSYDSKMKRRR